MKSPVGTLDTFKQSVWKERGQKSQQIKTSSSFCTFALEQRKQKSRLPSSSKGSMWTKRWKSADSSGSSSTEEERAEVTIWAATGLSPATTEEGSTLEEDEPGEVESTGNGEWDEEVAGVSESERFIISTSCSYAGGGKSQGGVCIFNTIFEIGVE